MATLVIGVAVNAPHLIALTESGMITSESGVRRMRCWTLDEVRLLPCAALSFKTLGDNFRRGWPLLVKTASSRHSDRSQALGDGKLDMLNIQNERIIMTVPYTDRICKVEWLVYVTWSTSTRST